jgi:hypothetical protein
MPAKMTAAAMPTSCCIAGRGSSNTLSKHQLLRFEEFDLLRELAFGALGDQEPQRLEEPSHSGSMLIGQVGHKGTRGFLNGELFKKGVTELGDRATRHRAITSRESGG